MKIIYRIPTREQYAFYEVTEENKDMTDKEIAERYIALTNAYHDKISEVEETKKPF